MRKETVSIAFVLDEYGGFLGMITLFDILEAFVGEISTVEEEPELVQRTDGSYLADGLLHIDDLKRVLGIKTDLPGEAKNTLSYGRRTRLISARRISGPGKSRDEQRLSFRGR